MKKRYFHRKKFFSLLEVVVSLAILAISLTGLLQLLISSQKRAASAFEAWDRMHKITQGAEFLMLNSTDVDSVDEEFFPYGDCHLNIHYEDVEDLPEELSDQNGQLPLTCLNIELIRNTDGKMLEKLQIDRINFDSTAAGE